MPPSRTPRKASAAILEKQDAVRGDWQALFRKHDADGDGRLDRQELLKLLKDVFEPGAGDAEVRASLDEFVALLDADGDGYVDPDEFAASWNAWFAAALEPVCALVIIDVQNDFIDGTLRVPDAAAIVPVVNGLRATGLFDMTVISMDWHPADHSSFVEVQAAGESPVPAHGSQATPLTEVPAFGTAILRAPDGGPMAQTLWPRHCVQGTRGAENHPDLVVDFGDDDDDYNYSGPAVRCNNGDPAPVGGRLPPPSRRRAAAAAKRAGRGGGGGVDGGGGGGGDVFVVKGCDARFDSYSAFWDNMKLAQTSLCEQLRARGVTHVFMCGLALDVCVKFTALHAAEHAFMSYVVRDASRGLSPESNAAAHEALAKGGVTVIDAAEVPAAIRGASLEEALDAARRASGVRSIVAAVDAESTGSGHIPPSQQNKNKKAQQRRGASLSPTRGRRAGSAVAGGASSSPPSSSSFALWFHLGAVGAAIALLAGVLTAGVGQ
jgi:nicotinamidase/pyrazinamidase